MVVPGFIPVTTPVNEPTVAILVKLLLQVPPLAVSASGVVAPTHTLKSPVMTPAELVTVTVVATDVGLQPVPSDAVTV